MIRRRAWIVLPMLALVSVPGMGAPPGRKRAREVGVAPGVFAPGAWNAITDVAGVTVGHVTRFEGDRVRTGVTAIVPHGGNVFREKTPGAVFVGNAFGKLAGSTQVEELGTIETPVVLTNTLAVGTAVEAVVEHTLARAGNESVRSVNAVVGETNDGGLNDIRGRHVTREDVIRAIATAAEGPVAEGCVGAGTGCEAFGWKGGIGTSSRVVPTGGRQYTVGVLVQANFGGVLTIAGAPVGIELGRHAFRKAQADHHDQMEPRAARPADGSCMIVVATDAPLLPRDLKRLATRSVFALARTGSSFSNGSGDFAIAFSTDESSRVRHGEQAVRSRDVLPTDALDGLFQGVLEATEEAVDNALFMAETTSGRAGRRVEALPIEEVMKILEKHGLIRQDARP